MDINIRKYIKDNFKDSDLKEIEESITVSIKQKDDITLPGLGVFFEILWEESNKENKEKILEILKNALNVKK